MPRNKYSASHMPTLPAQTGRYISVSHNSLPVSNPLPRQTSVPNWWCIPSPRGYWRQSRRTPAQWHMYFHHISEKRRMPESALMSPHPETESVSPGPPCHRKARSEPPMLFCPTIWPAIGTHSAVSAPLWSRRPPCRSGKSHCHGWSLSRFRSLWPSANTLPSFLWKTPPQLLPSARKNPARWWSYLERNAS